MALFNKQNLKAVVSIQVETEKGRGEYRPSATGVLIGFVSEKSEDPNKTKYRIFLMTNRHVFENKGRVWLRFDKAEGGGTKIFPVDLKVGKKEMWLSHRNKKIDLAMLTVSPQFLTQNGVAWHFVQEELFAYHKDFERIGISPGDEIFITGFPLGLVGETQNFALVRSGMLSRTDNEVVKEAGAFLVDASIFPGNSGGPIFFKPAAVGLQDTTVVERAYLLGIVSGNLPEIFRICS